MKRLVVGLAFMALSTQITVCPKNSEPLNILQQQPQICSDLNKILHTQNDICYKHYYIVSYKSALTLLKYEYVTAVWKNWTSRKWNKGFLLNLTSMTKIDVVLCL